MRKLVGLIAISLSDRLDTPAQPTTNRSRKRANVYRLSDGTGYVPKQPHGWTDAMLSCVAFSVVRRGLIHRTPPMLRHRLHVLSLPRVKTGFVVQLSLA